jgi:YidC/Oxa1 family membrane protein insertase
MGCLPVLAQLPVFLGLYHVLRSFNRTVTGGFGGSFGPHLSVEQNRATGNYIFSPSDVGHFLDANLFGAPLGASMTQSSGLDAFTEFSRGAVVGVGLPVMIMAGIATYLNSRASIARQSPEAAANPQTAIMNRLMLYVFPFGVVFGGLFLPLAIIFYWFANNIWTFAQQHYVFGHIEKEEEAKKLEAQERRASNAPAPGAKPNRTRKVQAAADDGAADAESTATELGTDGDAPDSSATKPSAGNTSGNPARRPGATPRPGARPRKRKR